MSKGQVVHPLAFLKGGDIVAAACLRKISNDRLIAGVLIRSADGLFRERIDVNEGEISTDVPVRWELELLRVGTRQTTALVRWTAAWWPVSTATPRASSPIPVAWGSCIRTAGCK